MTISSPKDLSQNIRHARSAPLDTALDRRVTARTCHQHALHRPTTTSLVHERTERTACFETGPKRRALAVLCAPLLALGVTACGSATVSTSGFSGEDRDVAQAISNLQSDATAGEEAKICARDLAGPVVARLGGVKGCEAAIKNRLTEVDSFELSVASIRLDGTTASARVRSVHSGKSRLNTLTLTKEGGKWKTSELQ